MENEFISSIDDTSQGVPSTDLMSAFETAQESNPNGSIDQQQVQEPVVEIDERFKNLPHAEAIARSLQSKYDKLYAEHTNTVRDIEQKLKYEQFVTELMEDDQVLEAFLNERKPELVQKKDFTSVIQEKLKTEFGDYKPTRDEIEVDDYLGSKAWLYNKRLDSLYTELTGKTGKTPQTIKELKEERARVKQAEEAKNDLVFDQLKKENNWDDVQVKSFYEWAQKLSPSNLAKMYNFAKRTMRIPSATGIAGNPQVRSSRNAFIDSI